MRSYDAALGSDLGETAVVVLCWNVLDVVIKGAARLESLLRPNYHLWLSRLNLRNCLVYIVLSHTRILLKIGPVVVILVFDRRAWGVLAFDGYQVLVGSLLAFLGEVFLAIVESAVDYRLAESVVWNGFELSNRPVSQNLL